MRLYAKMKKTLAVATLTAVAMTAVPVTTFASDYTGHWAEQAITKWSEEGILKGYEDGSFKPENTITRAELAQIISGIFGLVDITGGKDYTDIADNSWYANSVRVVAAAGIMNDFEDGTFRPDQPATREEAAYAIARAYRMAASEDSLDFTDKAEISGWAEEEVAALVAGGVLSGYPDGSFKPQGSLKRSEVVFMIDRITSDLVNNAGTYSQDIEGNLVVNTKDVVLKDMTITGNLYLAEGIKDGDVTLDGVTVLGDVIVEGGGANTVNIKGKSVINNIIVDKTSGETPRILMNSQVIINGEVVLETSTVLEGENVKLPNIVVTGAGEVKIKGNVQVTSIKILKPVKLDLAKDIKVETVKVAETAPKTAITGLGKVAEVNVEANGTELKVKVDKVTVGDTVTEKPVVTPPTGGGGGGGGGGGTTVPDKEAVKINSFEVKLVGGNTKTVTVEGAIDIQVNDDYISVEGQRFNPGDQIEKIKINSNAKDITVSYMASTVYKVTLQSGIDYTPTMIKNEIERQNLATHAKAFIQEFGAKVLKPQQVTLALQKFDTYYAELMSELNTDSIAVTSLLNKAKEVEKVLESDKYLDNHADIVKLAKAIGIEIEGLNVTDIQGVTATGSIIQVGDPTGPYNSKTYTVNAKYNGVIK